MESLLDSVSQSTVAVDREKSLGAYLAELAFSRARCSSAGKLLDCHRMQLGFQGWRRLLRNVVQLVWILVEIIHLNEEVGAIRRVIVVPVGKSGELRVQHVAMCSGAKET